VLPILLAGASALVWGTADYCGGKAVQRGNPAGRGQALSVTVFSQLSAVPMIALFLLLVPGRFGVSALIWGGLAGIAGLFGIVLLYQGLSSGAMAIVAPTTAVTAAVVPLIGGLLMGERPGAAAMIGALLAVIAIGLVSLGPSRTTSAVTLRVIGLALLAGACFGVFFILLRQAGDGAGMWPLAAARFAGLPLGLLLLRPMGGSLRLAKGSIGLAIVAGVLDITANATYLIAAYQGAISIVAPISSLYPASTVLLALAIDRERLRAIQVAGLGVAAAALVLAAS
jgi:drug/metabolite transporter (DMT)-like permease